MIVYLFGAVDFVVALMLLFGDIPGPAFFVKGIALLLAIKALISFVYIPIVYMPGIMMNLIDFFAIILLVFGAIPLAFLKTGLIIVMAIKALPKLAMDVMKLVG